MLGVTDSRAKLWVDCQPVKSIQGNIEYPLRERGQYDTHDGYLSIAQIANTRSYQVRVARQFMMTLLLNRWLIFPLFVSFLTFTLQSAPPVSLHNSDNRWERRSFCYSGGGRNQSPAPPIDRSSQHDVIFSFFSVFLLDRPSMDGYDLWSEPTYASELWWDSRKLNNLFLNSRYRQWNSCVLNLFH